MEHVAVDAGRCARCGACVIAAPAIFELTPGATQVRRQPMTHGERVACKAAAAACPTGAVRGRLMADEPGEHGDDTGTWRTMSSAVDELAAALEALPRAPMRAALISNRDGTIADDASVPRLIAGQLVRPVRWDACIDTL